ncbi:hypothetical protein ACJX0J_042568, partial [Zea mays]
MIIPFITTDTMFFMRINGYCLLVVSNNKTMYKSLVSKALVQSICLEKISYFLLITFDRRDVPQELNLGIKKLLHEVLEKVAQKEGEERFGFTHQAEKEDDAEKLALKNCVTQVGQKREWNLQTNKQTGITAQSTEGNVNMREVALIGGKPGNIGRFEDIFHQEKKLLNRVLSYAAHVNDGKTNVNMREVALIGGKPGNIGRFEDIFHQEKKLLNRVLSYAAHVNDGKTNVNMREVALIGGKPGNIGRFEDIFHQEKKLLNRVLSYAAHVNDGKTKVL